MDFSFSASDRDFADRLRLWLDDNLDRDWRAKFEPTSPEWIAFQKDWDRRLYDGGWGGIFWPKEHGGMGATLGEKVMFAAVLAEYGAPEGQSKLAKRLLGPIVMLYGTDEQKERFLPPILRAEEFWCQGFSEPGAGSDLAGLQTRAVIDGDVLRVTGQKVWTSHAWYTDWMFALVRTDPDAPRHDGITLVVLPTNAPGLDVRSVRQINRHNEFAEVFFNDVEVPMSDVIGPLNGGWQVAMSILGFERGAEMAFGRLGDAKPGLRLALEALQRRPELERAAHAADVGRLEADYFAFQINAMRLLSAQLAGGNPTEIASLSRLQSSEAWRRGTVSQLVFAGSETLGRPDEGGHLLEDYLTSRSSTIASGSSEIQRNIIARRILGMK